MTLDEIQEWLVKEFDPIMLATPPETIEQLVVNAVRYWNTHSGYRLTRMYNAAGAPRVQISPEFKSVTQVLPATDTEFVFRSHPLWTLLGFTIIDNVTEDLILLGETYRNYRYYIGEDFKWQFEPSGNPLLGGQLFLHMLPTGVGRIAVIGTKLLKIEDPTAAILVGKTASFGPQIGDKLKVRVDDVVYDDIDSNVATVALVAANINAAVGSTVADVDASGFLRITSTQVGYNAFVEVQTGTNGKAASVDKLFNIPATIEGIGDLDITDPYILEWLLEYSKSLLHITEGRLLRKGNIIGAKNDGSDLMVEGKDLKERLEKRLSYEGRWVALARRA